MELFLLVRVLLPACTHVWHTALLAVELRDSSASHLCLRSVYISEIRITAGGVR